MRCGKQQILKNIPFQFHIFFLFHKKWEKLKIRNGIFDFCQLEKQTKTKTTQLYDKEESLLYTWLISRDVFKLEIRTFRAKKQLKIKLLKLEKLESELERLQF